MKRGGGSGDAMASEVRKIQQSISHIHQVGRVFLLLLFPVCGINYQHEHETQTGRLIVSGGGGETENQEHW